MDMVQEHGALDDQRVNASRKDEASFECDMEWLRANWLVGHDGAIVGKDGCKSVAGIHRGMGARPVAGIHRGMGCRDGWVTMAPVRR
jgi:hypothetical protein